MSSKSDERRNDSPRNHRTLAPIAVVLIGAFLLGVAPGLLPESGLWWSIVGGGTAIAVGLFRSVRRRTGRNDRR